MGRHTFGRLRPRTVHLVLQGNEEALCVERKCIVQTGEQADLHVQLMCRGCAGRTCCARTRCCVPPWRAALSRPRPLGRLVLHLHPYASQELQMG